MQLRSRFREGIFASTLTVTGRSAASVALACLAFGFAPACIGERVKPAGPGPDTDAGSPADSGSEVDAATCADSAIDTCTSGDGCCPSGCNANNDSDCKPVCGTGQCQTAKFVNISFGFDRVGAVSESGNAYWWGKVYGAALGLSTPTKIDASGIPGGISFTAVSMGVEHMCGLAVTGRAYCWGDNLFGSLGVSPLTYEWSNVPLQVLLSSEDAVRFASLATLGYTNFAVDKAGVGYFWGDAIDNTIKLLPNELFILGSTGRPIGAAWTAGKAIKQIAASTRHVCALTTDQAIYCWGDNTYGAVSATDFATSSKPHSYSGPYKQVLASEYRTCGLSTSGGVHCWGIGDNAVPAEWHMDTSKVANGKGFRKISASSSWGDGCGLGMDGKGYCWGVNDVGQLGNGTVDESNKRYPLGPINGAPFGNEPLVDIGAGGNFSCAVTASGKVYCWGSHAYGGIGNGEPAGANIDANTRYPNPTLIKMPIE